MFGRMFAVLALVLVGAHLTGTLKGLLGAFDIGIEPRNWFFLLLMPFVCLIGIVLLGDERSN